MSRETEPSWEVTYKLKGETLASRTMRAKSAASAKLAAQTAALARARLCIEDYRRQGFEPVPTPH